MLEPIDVHHHDLSDQHASRQAVQLIEEAHRRIEAFTQARRSPIHNFVICDFQLVDHALGWIAEKKLGCGDRFCELGSGFGVVTMLAALHGLDASGIEIEPELVDQSQRLAEDLGIEARFAEGSFIPGDADELREDFEDLEHVDTDTADGYDNLGCDLSDFDLAFAFPWPGEERFWEAVFDRYASDGALLLSYHGIEGLKLQRRVG